VTEDRWYERQRRFYEAEPHGHLHADSGGLYADNLVARIWDVLGAGADARGVEIGCGSGRFTLPLLTRCAGLEAVDLSPRQLARLEEALAARGIARDRVVLHEANVEQLGDRLPVGRYDFVVGLFVLHHLHDPVATLAQLVRLLRPGGRLAFLEPNRLNPLFLFQIACCADMHWGAEKGIYRYGASGFEALLARAGATRIGLARAGFFPPQVLNRAPRAIALERWIERRRWIGPLLPFLIVSGERPVRA
jgi:SAM-dependent methyltransferase